MGKALQKAILIAFLATLGLTACGQKGALEKPPGAAEAPKPGPDGKQPHRPSILDALIR